MTTASTPARKAFDMSPRDRDVKHGALAANPQHNCWRKLTVQVQPHSQLAAYDQHHPSMHTHAMLETVWPGERQSRLPRGPRNAAWYWPYCSPECAHAIGFVVDAAAAGRPPQKALLKAARPPPPPAVLLLAVRESSSCTMHNKRC